MQATISVMIIVVVISNGMRTATVISAIEMSPECSTIVSLPSFMSECIKREKKKTVCVGSDEYDLNLLETS